MAGKKSAWDVLSKQDAKDTMKNRDVYDDQQLERSDLPKVQSPTFRVILTIIITIFAMVLAYVLLSIGSFTVSSISKMSSEGISSITQSDSGGSSSTNKADAALYEEYGDLNTFQDWITSHGYTFALQNGNAGYSDSNGKFHSEESLQKKYEKTLKKASKRKDELQKKYHEGKYAEGADARAQIETETKTEKTILDYFAPTMVKVIVTLFVGLIVFGLVYNMMMRNLKAQNIMSDTTDINQYKNDQHIALPEEVQRKFDWFPDVGAHSNVQVSSMISHMALMNKGLKKVDVAKRAEKDIYDEDGDVEYYKGEIIVDEDGNPITSKKPIVDMEFMDALFQASDPKNWKAIRKYYDATKIPYNPDGKDRTKQGGTHATVADMINADWDLPLYEPQRPAGAYIVDTEPVNTMVLAITRAGKGNMLAQFV